MPNWGRGVIPSGYGRQTPAKQTSGRLDPMIPGGTTVCLSITTADLGPADACLDEAADELVFTPGLDDRQRAVLARRLLTQAGYAQPNSGVACRCGRPLLTPARRTA